MLIFLLIILISILIYLIITNVFFNKKVIDNTETNEEINRLLSEYKEILERTNEEIPKNYKIISSLKKKIQYKLKQ